MIMKSLVVFGLLAVSQIMANCCGKDDPDIESAFCTVYNMLSDKEQSEVQMYLGENCDGDVEDALKSMEKRKPNFIRFGRSENNPNFLRFGKSPIPNDIKNMYRLGKKEPSGQLIKNMYRLGKRSDESQNIKALYRLGKKGGKPTFLRFGKRGDDSSNPNFLRFGKDDPNFLRFGRSDDEKRKPNFLRFG